MPNTDIEAAGRYIAASRYAPAKRGRAYRFEDDFADEDLSYIGSKSGTSGPRILIIGKSVVAPTSPISEHVFFKTWEGSRGHSGTVSAYTARTTSAESLEDAIDALRTGVLVLHAATPRGWFEASNTATRRHQFPYEAETSQDLILHLGSLVNTPYGVALAKEIVRLSEDTEDDPEQAPLATDSLRSFVNFLEQYPDAKLPVISLTPDGHVYARWKGPAPCLFSVDFFPNGDCKFVMFKQNPRHHDKRLYLSGVATVDSLIGGAIQRPDLAWMLK